MRYQVSRRWRTVLLVPIAAVLLGAGSATVGHAAPAAEAVTPSAAYLYFPLLSDRTVFPAPGEQKAAVVTTPPFLMQPGDMRRVTDQLDVRLPSGHDYPEVGNEVVCYDQDWHPIGSASSGTNYTQNGHAYQWNVSMLLVAPSQNPAENYFCQLLTYVTSGTDTNFQMTVLAPTQGQTTYGTWLEVSNGNQAGAQAFWDGIGTCQTDGTGNCQYIGGPARLDNPPAIDVFSGDTWTAADNATTIDAVATFQITTCTSGTGSCPASEHGDSGVYDGKGDSYLGIEQLYPNGSVCRVSYAYSEESTGGQVLLTENYDISDDQHHRPLYYHVSAPVSQLCDGSRNFAIDLHIQWTADNGVKIDGGNVSVINSVRATTTTVPVLTGLTAGAAKAVIAAAGLILEPPVYVVSTYPKGTVIDQDAPAGTIEPVGSPVQITVSLG